MEYIVKPPVSFVYIMMVSTEGFQILSVDISYLKDFGWFVSGVLIFALFNFPTFQYMHIYCL